MRIVVVEDDARLTSVLERALSQEGWNVEVAHDGPSGERLLHAGTADAAILDLGLPGKDGLALLQGLRAKGSSLPVLVLTARDAVEDRVRGLDRGADDYLVKPFALDELLARVRALLRRGSGADPVLRYADLELDPSRGTAMRAGKRLPLRPKEHALLEYFLRHPEEVLSRVRIYEHVWASRYDGWSNVIEVYVRYLRLHLEELGSRLVHTVRGRGYILASQWSE